MIRKTIRLRVNQEEHEEHEEREEREGEKKTEIPDSVFVSVFYPSCSSCSSWLRILFVLFSSP
jgi:hypothetical protein